jgi:hypothetical protein
MSTDEISPPICPACGQSTQVEKVSTLYMDAIGAGRLPAVGRSEESGASAGRRLTGVPDREQRNLVRRLAPPSSGRRSLTRLVHPDQMVLSFSVMILVFVGLMLRSEPQLIWPVGGILILCYLLYLWRRPRIIERYEREVLSLRDNYLRTEAAVGVWMRLYYCGRDDGVFIPGEAELVPLDEMGDFLYRRGVPPPSQRARQDRR